MGIPEFEAKRYEGHLQKGGILLSVHCDTPGEIMRAKEVISPRAARKSPPRENPLLIQRQPIITLPVRLLTELTSPEGESLFEAFSFSFYN